MPLEMGLEYPLSLFPNDNPLSQTLGNRFPFEHTLRLASRLWRDVFLTAKLGIQKS